MRQRQKTHKKNLTHTEININNTHRTDNAHTTTNSNNTTYYEDKDNTLS